MQSDVKQNKKTEFYQFKKRGRHWIVTGKKEYFDEIVRYHNDHKHNTPWHESGWNTDVNTQAKTLVKLKQHIQQVCHDNYDQKIVLVPFWDNLCAPGQMIQVVWYGVSLRLPRNQQKQFTMLGDYLWQYEWVDEITQQEYHEYCVEC